MKPKSPIAARLYFYGTEMQLKDCSKLIFHIPGGGFVAMRPENHDEYVSNWARQTKLPIVSINYGKAPENPYPWGLEECFEAYRSIVETNGNAIGLYPTRELKIVITGDSAGGNLAVGVMLKCLEYQAGPIRLPHASLLIYPALSFDLECWMKPTDLHLLRTQSHLQMTEGFLKSKTQLRKHTPLHVHDGKYC
jgi:acetyl esterase/lipase